jgi:cytochrome c-type biogenesis protein CcmH
MVVVLTVVTSVSLAFAVEPNEIMQDPALEQRARVLSRELRCMVCQNQSIDDSNAPLARDLRILVRERLKAGDRDDQVLDFLVARYGEFVLLRPRFAWHTALLWLAPLVILAVGGFAIIVFMRRRETGSGELTGAPTLTDDEQARLAAILERRED